jgi:hypothetical protein
MSTSRFLLLALVGLAAGAFGQRITHPASGRAAPAPAAAKRRAPPARGPQAVQPAPQTRAAAPAPRANEAQPPRYFGESTGPATRVERPRVDERGHWVGHESGPRDRRYELVHPFRAGRFTGELGGEHLYRLHGWDAPRHRFWFNGFAWGIAPWDVEYADDWDWDGDQIALYDDPDHEGWYLAYNERLGTYVHVQYDGAMDQ